MNKYSSEGMQFLYDRYVAGDPEAEAYYETLGVDMDVASAIYELRTKLGLTQKALAEKAGTTHSVISRLEDSEYRGHSVAMLRRIGDAVGFHLVIGFVPKDQAAAEPAPVASKPPGRARTRSAAKTASDSGPNVGSGPRVRAALEEGASTEAKTGPNPATEPAPRGKTSGATELVVHRRLPKNAGKKVASRKETE